MKAAVVAIEDRRFFSHSGVDWRGVGRAVVANLATSGAALDGQGASTITMQYVKNHRLYALADSPEERDAATADTLDRKLLDVTVALALEDRLGKQEILARYLDTVYFGHGAYGVAAAVRAEERASFTLGPVPAIPLELANVAATLVSGGMWCPPTPVVSVTDSAGAPVELPVTPCEQAVPEALADTLAVGLSEDHTVGNAADAADAAGWDRPMIGKTGATQNNLSAGFVGATPQLAAAVLTWADGSPPRPVCADHPSTRQPRPTKISEPERTAALPTPLPSRTTITGWPDPDPEELLLRCTRPCPDAAGAQPPSQYRNAPRRWSPRNSS